MDRQRLAEYVLDRRAELGWSQADLAERARLRPVTVSDIETAKERHQRPATIAKLERALHWKPGSVRSIANGGEPELAGDDASGDSVPADLRDQTERTLWTSLDLSDDDKWFLINLYRDRMARRQMEETDRPTG